MDLLASSLRLPGFHEQPEQPVLQGDSSLPDLLTLMRARLNPPESQPVSKPVEPVEPVEPVKTVRPEEIIRKHHKIQVEATPATLRKFVQGICDSSAGPVDVDSLKTSFYQHCRDAVLEKRKRYFRSKMFQSEVVHEWKRVVKEFVRLQGQHPEKITTAFLVTISNVNWSGEHWRSIRDFVNKK